MTTSSSARRLAEFESCRRDLVALAYRMLGDMGRAEDMVQEAWLRWGSHEVEASSPKAYLTTVVTRLCLNELESASAAARGGRREDPAGLLPRRPQPSSLCGPPLQGFEP
ncbi:sigma factor [Sorangium atrum]|uniref:Sigma factor n=1 Tax=Sorangium atrum TaxID=2995308 RepID=A0ABT5BX90_9BACT|nr:sigma factor [Sorangium aterium]MDC0678767.1 sigma factor [Sorangium aterium]